MNILVKNVQRYFPERTFEGFKATASTEMTFKDKRAVKTINATILIKTKIRVTLNKSKILFLRGVKR